MLGGAFVAIMQLTLRAHYFLDVFAFTDEEDKGDNDEIQALQDALRHAPKNKRHQDADCRALKQLNVMSNRVKSKEETEKAKRHRPQRIGVPRQQPKLVALNGCRSNFCHATPLKRDQAFKYAHRY